VNGYAELVQIRGWAACILAFDRAQRLGGELAAVEEAIACGGGAEIAENEVLGHAVVKLSPKNSW
jgi:hypothetical protein